MPLFRREPEDAPRGPGADPLASDANLQQHGLTQELLDWLIHSLTAVLQTAELQDLANRRTQQAMRDALKFADYLYPHTVEVRRASRLHELENRDTGVTDGPSTNSEYTTPLFERTAQEEAEEEASDPWLARPGSDGPTAAEGSA